MARQHGKNRTLYMLGLIVAGEVVFALPFHIARYFRPTVLEVFGLSNTELGLAWGHMAWWPCWPIFPAGCWLTGFRPAGYWLFIVATAAGGVYMSSLPSVRGAILLWAFFGLTSILLSWAALIRATRDWGGADTQGRAFGLLEAVAVCSLRCWPALAPGRSAGVSRRL